MQTVSPGKDVRTSKMNVVINVTSEPAKGNKRSISSEVVSLLSQFVQYYEPVNEEFKHTHTHRC